MDLLGSSWGNLQNYYHLLLFINYLIEDSPSDLYHHKILGLISINYDLEDVVNIMLMNVLNDVGLIGLTKTALNKEW